MRHLRAVRRTTVAALAVYLVVVGAAVAANFLLTKTAETNSTITFSYPAQAGADGYRYYAPGNVTGERCAGTAVSRTFNSAQTSVRFGKVQSGTYCVEAVVLTPIGAGQYPVAVPPAACADGQDNDGDGLVDLADPGCSTAADNDETNVVPPPPSGQFFVATTGNDAGGCTQAAPCRTFNRAYQVANLGDTVSVAAGTYPAQTINAAPGKSALGDSADVTFLSAGTVQIGDLTFGVRGGANGASHVVIDGNNTTTILGEINTFLPQPSSPPSDITVTNLVVRDNGPAGIYVRGADRFTLRNVEVGPFCCGDDGMQVNFRDGTSTTRDVTNFTLDRVWMHDIVRRCQDLPTPMSGCSSSPSAHTDCIQWWSGVNVTIKNSRFDNCSTSTWLIQDEFGGRFANWTVENNMLGTSIEGASNIFRFACSGGCLSGFVHVRHNTMGNNLTIDPAARSSSLDVRVEGNLIDSQGDCIPGASYVDNVVTGTGCGSDRVVPSIGVVKLAAPGTNLRPTASSPAIDAIPCHLPQDIDGETRPRGPTCDAGADER